MKIKRVCISLLCIVFLFQWMMPTTLADTNEGASVTMVDLLKKGTAEPSDAFKSLVIKTNGKVTDGKIPLAIEFEMKCQEYLNAKLEELVDAGTIMSEDAYDADDTIKATYATYDEYLDAQTCFIPISFSCSFDNEEVGIDTDESGSIMTTDGNQDKIGSYTLKTDSEKNIITFRCTMDNHIYNRTTCVGTKLLSLTARKSTSGDENTEIKEGQGDVTVSIVLHSGPVNPGQDDGTYSILKSAPQNVDTPYIDYDIDAKVTPKTAESTSRLNDKIIRDTIPDGLKIDKVLLNNQPLVAGQDYSVENGIFTYRFPAYDDKASNAIMEGKLHITMGLTSDQYKAIMQSNKEFSHAFTNKASLYAPDIEKPLVTSGQVKTNMKFSFFTKDGKQEGLNGKRFLWTIKLNTYFSDATNSFLVDTLDNTNTAHDYDVSSGIMIMNDNKTDAITPAVEESESASYDDLTVDTVKSIMEKYPNQKAIIYHYDSNNDHINDKGILIIRTDDYVNTPIRVKYYTNVVSNAPSEATSQTVKNAVKFVWEWLGGGNGTGFDDKEFHIDISKDVTANYQLVDKKHGTYDETTHQLTWNFAINEFGADMSPLEITDTLKDDVQVLSDTVLTDHQTLSLDKYDLSTHQKNGTLDLPYYDGNGAAPANYYKIEKDNAAKTTSFIVHMDHVAETDYYILPMSTIIVDPSFLSVQGRPSIENTATVNATIAGVPYEKKTSDKCWLANTLIVKDNLPFENNVYYNAVDHTTQWKTTVNPYHVSITDGVLTDDLPTGTSFNQLVGVTRIDADGNKTEGIVDGKNVSFADGITWTYDEALAKDDVTQYAQNKAIYRINKANETHVTSTDSFVFTYTTNYENDYRQKEFNNKAVTSINKATLTGNIDGIAIKNAVDDAKVTMTVSPVTKEGIYYDNKPYTEDTSLGNVSWAKWTITLNRDRTDMSGAVLTDDLKSFFELDSSTVKVYKASVSENGTISLGDEVTTDADIQNGLKLNTNSLEFTIPESYKTQILVITFNTLVCDTARKSDMKNGVTLKGKNGYETHTGDQTADGAQDFNVEEFAKTTKAPYIKIRKASQNSVYDDKGLPKFPLQGAEFTLTPVIQKNGEWQARDDMAKKVKITSDTGIANFFFLKKDVLYKIEESNAPDGYVLSKDIHYFIFDSTGSLLANDFPNGTQIIPNINYKILDLTNIPGTEDPGETATHGRVEFIKQTDDGQLVPNISFTLSDVNGRLKSQTVQSDANGKVVFDPVDEGTYTITENDTPKGVWAPKSSLKAEVSYDKTAKVYSFVITNPSDNDGLENLVHDSNQYRVENIYKRGTIALTKVRTNQTNQKVSGAEFTVYTTGNTPVAYLTEQGNTGIYTLMDHNKAGDSLKAKNQDGVPYLQQEATNDYALLIGDYYVVETTTPNNYAPVTENNQNKQYPITITEGKQSTITVDNLFTPGSITGKKVSETGAPLSGAVIGLFAKGETTFTEKTSIKTPIKTDKKGQFSFSQLPLGDYVVAEIEAPTGYYLNRDTHINVTVTEANPDVTQDVNGKDISITDTRIPVAGPITLTKLRTGDTSKKVSGAEFTVYTNTDIAVAYLTETTEKGVYHISNTNKAGNTLMAQNEEKTPYLEKQTNGDLYILFGDYYAVETTTPAGYLSNMQEGVAKKYPLTIGLNAPAQLTVTNDFAPGTIVGKKVTETGAPLSGAVIGLFPEGTTQFTADKSIASTTSDEDGAFRFTKLPLGKYTVAELTPPSGYYLNASTSYTVEITETAWTVNTDQKGNPISISNRRRNGGTVSPSTGPTEPSSTKGSLTITKRSGDGKLEGFTFVIKGDGYEKEATTDSTGKIVLDGLTPGNYTISEKATDETKVYVLPSSQTVYVGTTNKNVEFFNALKNHSVTITKKDAQTGAVLAGCVVSIKNNLNQIVTTITTDNNGIASAVLEPGSYTYVEITAPNGYALDTNEHAFIIGDATETLMFTLTNSKEEIKTPGDPTNPITPEKPTPTNGSSASQKSTGSKNTAGGITSSTTATSSVTDKSHKDNDTGISPSSITIKGKQMSMDNTKKGAHTKRANKADSSSIPNTGDAALPDSFLWLMMLISSAGMLIIFIIKRKEKQK